MHCATVLVTDNNNCHSAFHNSKFQHVSPVHTENKENNWTIGLKNPILLEKKAYHKNR